MLPPSASRGRGQRASARRSPLCQRGPLVSSSCRDQVRAHGVGAVLLLSRSQERPGLPYRPGLYSLDQAPGRTRRHSRSSRPPSPSSVVALTALCVLATARYFNRTDTARLIPRSVTDRPSPQDDTASSASAVCRGDRACLWSPVAAMLLCRQRGCAHRRGVGVVRHAPFAAHAWIRPTIASSTSPSMRRTCDFYRVGASARA